ncbi:MAG: DUF4249 domain-containing protein [Chitinophagaceae bacterium]
MRYAVLILSSILLMFASCEKVINVDLKNSDKRVVIQGFITDESGTVNHTIMVSRSVAFSASNEPDFVQGALVVVTDLTEGRSDTTLEVSPGNYQTQRTPGVPGHTYQLVAKVGDETFTSTSTMPSPVAFDSLYVDSFSAFGGVLHQFTPVFQDPAGQSNYYAFQMQINDTLLNTIDAWDDQYSDGKINSRPLNVNDEDLFSGKDTVTVTMYCTEKAIYNFFYTLVNATGNGQTPANPLSTISGNALGYFGAVTMRRRILIMP